MPVAAALLAACGETSDQLPPEMHERRFVGSNACASCHDEQTRDWTGSHHHLAMQDATSTTVLGDFSNASFEYHGTSARFYTRDGAYYVHTDDVAGEAREFRIVRAFGVAPLQQYLVEFPGGRLQALPYSWDSRSADDGGQHWFHVYGEDTIAPSDLLHWTGREQNWNTMCAECHSTNVAMGYDPGSDTFDTTYSEVGVGCEACHGPGSLHVTLAAEGDGTAGLAVDLDDQDDAVWRMNPATGIAERSEAPLQPPQQAEACGRCHARRGVIDGDYEYGRPLADTHRPALLDDGLYFADGQMREEVYVYGSFLQSRMYRAGVTCSDCHNPHSAGLRGGTEPSGVCAQCHLPATFAVKSHSGHETGQASCVDCHMTSRTYMVVDDRRDHSFRVPRPDLSARIGTPNPCNQCHADRDASWAAGAIGEWHGTATSERREFATAIAAGREGFANAALRAVIADTRYPGIARATAVSLMAAPPSREDLRLLGASFADPDGLVRVAALRQLRGMPAEYKVRADRAVALLADPLRLVRIEAAAAFAGAQDLLAAADARAYAGAASEYEAAFELLANRPEAHVRLGDFALANNEPLLAIEHYERALRIEPRFALARANLVDVYRANGKEDRGEALLREGLRLDPGDAALRHVLGLLLARTGRTDAGIDELRAAATGAPDDPRYTYVLAVALNSTGEHDGAIDVLRRAKDRFPTNFDIAWGLATMLRDRGDAARALAIADELVARHPDNASVRRLQRSLQETQ